LTTSFITAAPRKSLLAETVTRDRVRLAGEHLANESDLEIMEQQIAREIEAAFHFALESPNPVRADAAAKVNAC
jgi:TPP-dependent pyruvate/acetoin dehydrogenase alpha subunit